MFRFKERIKNIEEFNKRTLTNEEKLEIAFEEQCYNKFEELLKTGTDGNTVIKASKRIASGRLSICQCDMLKLLDKYKKREQV